MDKRILKEISKRWCKAILEMSEASIAFENSGLNEDEINFIQSEIQKISSRITNLPSNVHTDHLVAEYYTLQPSS